MSLAKIAQLSWPLIETFKAIGSLVFKLFTAVLTCLALFFHQL
jgi:hypothetical protein